MPPFPPPRPLLCCPWGFPLLAYSVLPAELIKAHRSPRKSAAWLPEVCMVPKSFPQAPGWARAATARVWSTWPGTQLGPSRHCCAAQRILALWPGTGVHARSPRCSRWDFLHAWCATLCTLLLSASSPGLGPVPSHCPVPSTSSGLLNMCILWKTVHRPFLATSLGSQSSASSGKPRHLPHLHLRWSPLLSQTP